MIVVDTNVISYLFLPGTYTAKARAAILKDPEWASPLLWQSEFRNVLATYVRENHITVDLAIQIAHEAETLMRAHQYQVRSDHVLALAATSGSSAYDCEFVALADELGLPLVTSDSRLVRAFPNTAVKLADFAA